MLPSIGKFVGTAVVLTGLSFLALLPVPAQNPNTPGDVDPSVGTDAQSDAGFLSFAGGFVRGKRVRTNTTLFTVPESAPGWVSLPGGNVTWSVPAATTDLFNVAFSAECGLGAGASALDYVRIRIVDIVGGAIVGIFEPYDGNQSFCSGNTNLPAETHKGNWVRRVNPGGHVIQVQFQIQDNAALGAVTAFIDDWTLELVVYD